MTSVTETPRERRRGEILPQAAARVAASEIASRRAGPPVAAKASGSASRAPRPTVIWRVGMWWVRPQAQAKGRSKRSVGIVTVPQCSRVLKRRVYAGEP